MLVLKRQLQKDQQFEVSGSQSKGISCNLLEEIVVIIIKFDQVFVVIAMMLEWGKIGGVCVVREGSGIRYSAERVNIYRQWRVVELAYMWRFRGYYSSKRDVQSDYVWRVCKQQRKKWLGQCGNTEYGEEYRQEKFYRLQ